VTPRVDKETELSTLMSVLQSDAINLHMDDEDEDEPAPAQAARSPPRAPAPEPTETVPEAAPIVAQPSVSTDTVTTAAPHSSLRTAAQGFDPSKVPVSPAPPPKQTVSVREVHPQRPRLNTPLRKGIEARRQQTPAAASTKNVTPAASTKFSPRKTRSAGKAKPIPSSSSSSSESSPAQSTKKATPRSTRSSRRASVPEQESEPGSESESEQEPEQEPPPSSSSRRRVTPTPVQEAPSAGTQLDEVSPAKAAMNESSHQHGINRAVEAASRVMATEQGQNKLLKMLTPMRRQIHALRKTPSSSSKSARDVEAETLQAHRSALKSATRAAARVAREEQKQQEEEEQEEEEVEEEQEEEEEEEEVEEEQEEESDAEKEQEEESDAEKEQEEESDAEEEQVSTRRRLATPLRQEIVSAARRVGSKLSPKAVRVLETIASSASKQIAKRLATPLRQAIESRRRKSWSSQRRRLATPLREEIARAARQVGARLSPKAVEILQDAVTEELERVNEPDEASSSSSSSSVADEFDPDVAPALVSGTVQHIMFDDEGRPFRIDFHPVTGRPVGGYMLTGREALSFAQSDDEEGDQEYDDQDFDEDQDLYEEDASVEDFDEDGIRTHPAHGVFRSSFGMGDGVGRPNTYIAFHDEELESDEPMTGRRSSARKSRRSSGVGSVYPPADMFVQDEESESDEPMTGRRSSARKSRRSSGVGSVYPPADMFVQDEESESDEPMTGRRSSARKSRRSSGVGSVYPPADMFVQDDESESDESEDDEPIGPEVEREMLLAEQARLKAIRAVAAAREAEQHLHDAMERDAARRARGISLPSPIERAILARRASVSPRRRSASPHSLTVATAAAQAAHEAMEAVSRGSYTPQEAADIVANVAADVVGSAVKSALKGNTPGRTPSRRVSWGETLRRTREFDKELAPEHVSQRLSWGDADEEPMAVLMVPDEQAEEDYDDGNGMGWGDSEVDDDDMEQAVNSDMIRQALAQEQEEDEGLDTVDEASEEDEEESASDSHGYDSGLNNLRLPTPRRRSSVGSRKAVKQGSLRKASPSSSSKQSPAQVTRIVIQESAPSSSHKSPARAAKRPAEASTAEPSPKRPAEASPAKSSPKRPTLPSLGRIPDDLARAVSSMPADKIGDAWMLVLVHITNLTVLDLSDLNALCEQFNVTTSPLSARKTSVLWHLVTLHEQLQQRAASIGVSLPRSPIDADSLVELTPQQLREALLQAGVPKLGNVALSLLQTLHYLIGIRTNAPGTLVRQEIIPFPPERAFPPFMRNDPALCAIAGWKSPATPDESSPAPATPDESSPAPATPDESSPAPATPDEASPAPEDLEAAIDAFLKPLNYLVLLILGNHHTTGLPTVPRPKKDVVLAHLRSVMQDDPSMLEKLKEAVKAMPAKKLAKPALESKKLGPKEKHDPSSPGSVRTTSKPRVSARTRASRSRPEGAPEVPILDKCLEDVADALQGLSTDLDEEDFFEQGTKLLIKNILASRLRVCVTKLPAEFGGPGQPSTKKENSKRIMNWVVSVNYPE
jgi:hypothetical protein